MKSMIKSALAGLICLGVAASVSLTAGCYDHHHDDHQDHEEYIDAHGYHHEGYWDQNHQWHGGYYDENHQYHQDAGTWHQ